MSTQNNILIAIDYSASSINALHEAARMATVRNLRLICVHILDAEVLGDFHKNMSSEAAGIFVAAQEKLDEFIKKNVNATCQIDALVKIGNPYVEIMRMIKDHQPETLVLGSHGSRTIYFEQIGGLASRCIRQAPVEVFLIRDAQNKPFDSIGACIDFSENSIRAAHRAAEIAVQDGAKLQLLHVYRAPSYLDTGLGWLGPAFKKNDPEEVKRDKEQELQKLRDELAAKHGLENISILVTEAKNIANGLYDVLKSIDADLVVLGTRGRTGLKGIFLGTTAESIIQTTPCSVLAVKPEGFAFEL